MAHSSTVETPEGGTITCEECGVELRRQAGWPETATLNRHRARAHGYVSPAKAKAEAEGTAPSAASAGGRRRATTPLEMLHAAGGEAKGRAAPTAEQLTKASGRALGYGSFFLASSLVDGDPRVSGEAEEAELVEHLALGPDEAMDIMRPLARIAAGTNLNKRYGRGLVDNLDVLDSFVALAAYFRRTTRYVADRRAAEGGGGQPLPLLRDGGRQPAPATPGRSPAPSAGVVVTPEMVADARRARQNGSATAATRPEELN